mmetsp:Transcript_98186/g.220036  ORF Transcript_98186/g.220036 Transcript_98186/m.220036 type:complete len:116 (-) Transcript_98186:106-453(-)
MSSPAKSWKHGFKAHRVAANMGNTSDNFIYHREQQSFPDAMPRPPANRGASKASGLSAQLQTLKRRALATTGAKQGSLGRNIGFGLPIAGGLIFYMFVFASKSDQWQTQQQLREV